MASLSAHPPRAPSAAEIHHALLRPVILQILRAQGYYTSTPRTIDTLTELTGNYITAISKQVVYHAADNNPEALEPSIMDVRMALEDCGALPGSRPVDLDMIDGEEDTHGVDEFIAWATGKKNQRIRKIAGLGTGPTAPTGEAGEEVEEPPTDYLSALKKKHNKTDQDSKYAGTILGKSIDHGEVPVEGGPLDSLAAWEQMMRNNASNSASADVRDDDDDDDRASRAPSSGLSSLDEGDVEMYDLKD
ncbi:hypothetical protein Micbo1qcDRAFT_200903 [Microdochium bolleyi]|uniref:Bromodomain associated domain-containing protein n=1 Tax=Microdochium bolleyi TaxID=196109 RepID=A0A136JEC3_9PEZI|nr:hypothetical protein Micbo1qcDRAFT_200903 [Microdochium bolleyi]